MSESDWSRRQHNLHTSTIAPNLPCVVTNSASSRTQRFIRRNPRQSCDRPNRSLGSIADVPSVPVFVTHCTLDLPLSLELGFKHDIFHFLAAAARSFCTSVSPRFLYFWPRWMPTEEHLKTGGLGKFFIFQETWWAFRIIHRTSVSVQQNKDWTRPAQFGGARFFFLGAIFISTEYPYAKTFRAQMRTVQEVQTIVLRLSISYFNSTSEGWVQRAHLFGELQPLALTMSDWKFQGAIFVRPKVAKSLELHQKRKRMIEVSHESMVQHWSLKYWTAPIFMTQLYSSVQTGVEWFTVRDTLHRKN